MPDDLSDLRLERELKLAAEEMDAAIERGDKDGFNVAWAKMQALHKQRSPEQVEKMERAQGLQP